MLFRAAPLARIAAAGAHVVVNPAHLPLDGALAMQRLGAVRAGARRTYAFSTLLKARCQPSCPPATTDCPCMYPTVQACDQRRFMPTNASSA